MAVEPIRVKVGRLPFQIGSMVVKSCVSGCRGIGVAFVHSLLGAADVCSPSPESE